MKTMKDGGKCVRALNKIRGKRFFLAIGRIATIDLILLSDNCTRTDVLQEKKTTIWLNKYMLCYKVYVNK